MPRITKTELLARIAQLEAELGLKDEEVKRLSTELNAYHYTERPSRTQPEHPVAPREPKPVSQWRLAAQAARDLAMRTGRAVRIGA